MKTIDDDTLGLLLDLLQTSATLRVGLKDVKSAIEREEMSLETVGERIEGMIEATENINLLIPRLLHYLSLMVNGEN